MNKENTKKLLDTYWFFGYEDWKDNRREAIRYTLMPFGFNCGDGWYNLIDQLCQSIVGVFENLEINAKYNNCEKPDRDAFRVLQVKEKFGTLRFYTGGMDKDLYERIEGRIAMAERMSAYICENCGQLGKLRIGGWWKTECDVCDKKHQIERKWLNRKAIYWYGPKRKAKRSLKSFKETLRTVFGA